MVETNDENVYGSSSGDRYPSDHNSIILEHYTAIKKPKETVHNGTQEINLVNITISTIEAGEAGEAVETTQAQQPQIMTFNNPPMNRWRLVCLCFWLLLSGASDATPGALLPEMEKYYGLSYSKASLIWLGNAIGFIIVHVHHINWRLGLATKMP